MNSPPLPRSVALVLSGGVALGAYEAGAYAALEAAGLRPDHVAGVSVGAINAAIIAGNAPEQRVARLREFWDGVTNDPGPAFSFWTGPAPRGPMREALNAAGVMQTFLLGRPGMFRPRPIPSGDGRPGLYDLSPLRARLETLVDFGRLNGGEVRLNIAATDVLTGERVVFEGGVNGGIGPDHVLASCAQFPVYAPVEVEGRLLGDGCFSGNTPVDLVLDAHQEGELACFAVELFARTGSRPRTVAAAAARGMDLLFGNQTHALLEGRVREGALRAALAELGRRMPEKLRMRPETAALLAEGSGRAAAVFLMGYRGGLDEAGVAKGFDYTAATLAERWSGGEAHVEAALRVMAELPPAGQWPAGVLVREVEN